MSRSSPLKNEPSSQKMHLKISDSGCQLKLSNSKTDCKVAVLHFLLNQSPPIASCCSGDENRRAYFQLSISFLTSVSLLETERGWSELSRLARTTKIDRLRIYSLWLRECQQVMRHSCAHHLHFFVSCYKSWTLPSGHKSAHSLAYTAAVGLVIAYAILQFTKLL
jgi:hypothetical protein